MEEDIVMNIDFEGISDPSIQVIPSTVTWEDFELLLKVFSNQDAILVTYVDEENEEITVRSDEELKEAFKVAKNANNTLCVHVKSGSPVKEDGVHNSEEEELVIADVKRQSVILMQVKQLEQDMKTGATDSGSAVAKASEPDVVSMETGELQKKEKVNAMETVEDNADPAKGEKAKSKFFLKNEASQLVLDVQHANKATGTSVIVWSKKSIHQGIKNQLWYEHKETGTLRSVLNDLCLDATENGATMTQYKSGRRSQQWRCMDNKIVNGFNKSLVIELPMKDYCPGKYVCAAKCRNEPHQRWLIKYPREIKKRPANEETGEKCVDSCQMLLTQTQKRCRKDRQLQGCYVKIAETFTNQQGARSKTRDCDSGETSPGAEAPPEWFKVYMAKFKDEITGEIANLVARKTVRQVLRGLEGAVITSVQGTSGIPGGRVPPTAQAQQQQQGSIYVHSGVVCDGCEQTIAGIRYKCGNCDDYDLCEDCENTEGIHNQDHVFLKIRRPVLTAGRKKSGKMNSLLKRNLYEVDEECRRQMEDKDQRREAKIRRKCEMIEQKLEQQMKKVETVVGGDKREEKIERMKRKEEKLKRRLEQIKESPTKKERLDLPQFRNSLRMDAKFVRDDTVPDGTHVQPETKLVKRWVMRNTGTHEWTSNTKLKMMWGNMTPSVVEVPVPYLQPDEEDVISVELVAPEEPGSYQSHWRLMHKGVRFGHRVWCHVTVDPKEILETAETNIDLNILSPVKEAAEREEIPSEPASTTTEDSCAAVAAAANLQMLSTDGATQVVDSEILTAQDIMSFEMLDIRDRHTPKVSQTATPNNTPLDMSPPKSPIPEEDASDSPLKPLSTSSSVEVVSEVLPETEAENAALMTQLVQERMASLGLKPDFPEAEILSISSFSNDSSDSDSDFYVVPIPDCFNPGLPPSKTASTSIYIKKEDELKSVDELLATSSTLSEQPLMPEKPASAEVDKDDTDGDSMPDLPFVDAEQPDIQIVALEEPDIQLIAYQKPSTDDVDFQAVMTSSDDDVVITKVTSPEEPTEETPLLAAQDAESVTEETGATSANEGEEENEEDSACKTKEETTAKPSDRASSLMNAAIGVALQTGAQVYCTAKGVFHTLQAQSQFVPPKSDWQPKESEWKPPSGTWTPPERDLLERKPTTPMEQLMEMGFCQRELNQKLLEKYSGNLEQVIQELISRDQNDWTGKRH